MEKVKVFPDMLRLSRAAAEFVVTQSKQAIQARGRFNLVLAGGATPQDVYSLLSTDTYAARIDWSKVYVFWGDERCVPPDHPESNYNMAWLSLLSHVPVPPENIFRIEGELDPKVAARNYADRLEAALGGPLSFDLIFLGLGEDGHTASLFPHTSALTAEHSPVVANYVEALRAWRVTLTARTLSMGANIIFLVAGERKAAAVKAVLEGEDNPAAFPAQSIQPTRGGKVIWLLDEAAASLLSNRGS
jgi:6-phosphogluconolactonase